MKCHPERRAQPGVEGTETRNFIINYLFFIMYKKMFFAAAVVATFAGCTKNEVNPVQTADQEITYQTAVGPKTKTLSDTQAVFDKDGEGKIFKSYAYFLPAGSTWDAQNGVAPELFINNETISKQNDVWKGTTSYYWPKQGSLTFFAWSTNAKDVTINGSDAAVGCTPETGVFMNNYSAVNNVNVDFMVADIAKDKKKNENVYATEGVPTLFRHKLCQVTYSVKTQSKYHASENYTTKGDKKFVLKSVTFTKLAQDGSYSQIPESWTLPAADARVDYTYPTAETVFDDQTAAKTEETAQYYFIPQSFDENSTVSLVYDIITTVDDEGRTSTETVTSAPIALYAAELFPDGWAINTKYVLNITIGLDEILWDPAVEDWTDGTAGNWTVTE